MSLHYPSGCRSCTIATCFLSNSSAQKKAWKMDQCTQSNGTSSKWNVVFTKQVAVSRDSLLLGTHLLWRPGYPIDQAATQGTVSESKPFVLGKGSTTSTCSLQASPIIVYILNPDTFIKFNAFIQVILSLPCQDQNKHVWCCAALFLQTFAALLPHLAILSTTSLFWWSLKPGISLIHFHALFLLRIASWSLLRIRKQHSVSVHLL